MKKILLICVLSLTSFANETIVVDESVIYKHNFNSYIICEGGFKFLVTISDKGMKTIQIWKNIIVIGILNQLRVKK